MLSFVCCLYLVVSGFLVCRCVFWWFGLVYFGGLVCLLVCRGFDGALSFGFVVGLV